MSQLVVSVVTKQKGRNINFDEIPYQEADTTGDGSQKEALFLLVMRLIILGLSNLLP